MLEEVDKEYPGILLAYGGHSQACGLTVADGKVDELRKILIKYCNTHFDKDVFVEKVVVDYIIKEPMELPRLYAEQNAMEPFGCGFESPIVMISFKPDETIANKHLRFKYKGIEVISLNSGDLLEGKDVNTIEEVIAVCTITNGKTLLADKSLLQFKFN
jgi:single-stranded DNA-specific DHH superfamily exonuclease